MTQMEKREGVYLLHFSIPYYSAVHYIGWSTDIDARFEEHRAGRGNPLVKAALEAGAEVSIARVWINKGRGFERSLKNRKNFKRLCPLCHNSWHKNGTK